MDVYFIRSRKGKLLMIVNEFSFCEESIVKNKIIWRCTSKKGKCRARIHTLGDKMICAKGDVYFRLSRRGGMQLVYKEYSYCHEGEKDGVAHWRCVKHSTMRCKSRVRTRGENVVHEWQTHNH